MLHFPMILVFTFRFFQGYFVLRGLNEGKNFWKLEGRAGVSRRHGLEYIQPQIPGPGQCTVAE